jgi:uncharacterized membrane protein YecN with MAPEG domain
MSLLITPLFLSAFIGMHIFLSFQVIKQRRKHKVRLGDAGLAELQNTMRAQANFAEYTPMFLLLLLMAEAQGMSKIMVHVFGIVFLTGRWVHAYSLLEAEQYKDGKITAFPNFRVAGMVATFTAITLLSLTVAGQYIWLVVL